MIKYNGMFHEGLFAYVQFVNDEGKTVDIQLDANHAELFRYHLAKLAKKISSVEPQNDEPSE